MINKIFRSCSVGMLFMIGCVLNIKLGGIAGIAAFAAVCTVIVRYYDLWNEAGQNRLIDLLVMFLWSIFGMAVMGLILFSISNFTVIEAAQAIIAQRLNDGLAINLLKGFGCGFLITCGTADTRSVIAGPAVFIVSIIAFCLLDFCYFLADFSYWIMAACPISSNIVICFLCTIAGNILGYLLFTMLWGHHDGSIHPTLSKLL